jgi:hypothetical protein
MVRASACRLAFKDFARCLPREQSCERAERFGALIVRDRVTAMCVVMRIAARWPVARSSSSSHDNSASTDGPRIDSTMCRDGLRPRTVLRTERQVHNGALAVGVVADRA